MNLMLSSCTTNWGHFIPISSVRIHFHLYPVVLSFPPVDDNLLHRLVYMTCLEFDEY